MTLIFSGNIIKTKIPGHCVQFLELFDKSGRGLCSRVINDWPL